MVWNDAGRCAFRDHPPRFFGSHAGEKWDQAFPVQAPLQPDRKKASLGIADRDPPGQDRHGKAGRGVWRGFYPRLYEGNVLCKRREDRALYRCGGAGAGDLKACGLSEGLQPVCGHSVLPGHLPVLLFYLVPDWEMEREDASLFRGAVPWDGLCGGTDEGKAAGFRLFRGRDADVLKRGGFARGSLQGKVSLPGAGGARVYGGSRPAGQHHAGKAYGVKKPRRHAHFHQSADDEAGDAWSHRTPPQCAGG